MHLHTCKNGCYHCFRRLCPVVISNSIPMLEYWFKYPALKLSSISQSSALILAHIIFNSAYCPCSIQVPQIVSYFACAADVKSKYSLACYLYMYVFLWCLGKIFSSAACCTRPCLLGDWQGLCSATPHREFCNCVNNIYQYCLLFLYNNVLTLLNYIFLPLDKPLIQRLAMLVYYSL